MGKLAKIDTVRGLLDQMSGELVKALPQHIPAEKFIRIALTTIQNTPKLLECDTKSLLGSLMESAQLGLVVDGVLGHASIIPFGKEAKLIPGYKGLVYLARNSGEVSDVTARVVYENEPFRYQEGLNMILDHKPLSPKERGKNRVGAYSRVLFKDGNVSVNFMWADQIEAIRDNTAAVRKGTQTPWTGTAFEQDEMWKKTAFRNHAKWLNLTPELTRLATQDEYIDAQVIRPDIQMPEAVDPDLEEVDEADVVDASYEVDGETVGADEQPDLPNGNDPTPKEQLEDRVRELGEVLDKHGNTIKAAIKGKNKEELQDIINAWEKELQG